jgi:hypothetical protein
MRQALEHPTDGFRRLGKGMIGPIQLRLRYQGIVRNVLVEQPVTPGEPVMYEIFDELGHAYLMSSLDSEVRVTAYEGRRTQVFFFRIAARPAVREEDLLYLKTDVVEQAQDEAKQRIMEQEDARLLILLAAAQTAYAAQADHVITPNHDVTETSGYFTPTSFYSASAQTVMHRLKSARFLVSPFDERDFYRWSVNETGWAFKDRTVAGEPIRQFGEFAFQQSISVPVDKMWLLPDPDFLGVMPVLQSLTVQENHRVESFWKGWVFSELISMVILNAAGIASVTKS